MKFNTAILTTAIFVGALSGSSITAHAQAVDTTTNTTPTHDTTPRETNRGFDLGWLGLLGLAGLAGLRRKSENLDSSRTTTMGSAART